MAMRRAERKADAAGKAAAQALDDQERARREAEAEARCVVVLTCGGVWCVGTSGASQEALCTSCLCAVSDIILGWVTVRCCARKRPGPYLLP
jgi:hypothetical protein